ncbi:MFS monocarboxylate transporter [Penicillium malachiteum]|uniref:MFS monocarboxylate transporter n=1 Tax=Penicillium malachiteum TaxID=1324776 RepID=UPI0025493A39|nr:MFS monocarboxylate transporter [Penicillium malachiteum]KAJ5721859.1 MFS monocarboxylate transporter [Penicillium malachiteum]
MNSDMNDTESVLSRKELDENAQKSPPSFPEGGTKGWLAVLACWCVMFNTFGYINAFGIYEAYYEETFLKNEISSNIAWIGSLQTFFMFSAGLISGPLMDRFGPKVIMIPCSMLFVLSVMLTSLCTDYYQFILAQGVLGGLANGLTYTPALTAVNHYFVEKRPLALGIASTGSSLAGVIFPVALDQMLNKTNLGFGWSVRIIGFLMLALSIIACATVSSNAPKRRSGSPSSVLAAWKNPAYTIQIMSFYLIAITNAGSMFGRLVGGALANQIGRFNTLAGSSVICGILTLCWISINSLSEMIVFSVLFGFFSGTVIGIFPATIAMTAPQPNEIGSYMGMGLGVLSFAGLTGTPITGAMITQYGGYHPAMIFAGVCSLVGAAIIFGARLRLAGRQLVA